MVNLTSTCITSNSLVGIVISIVGLIICKIRNNEVVDVGEEKTIPRKKQKITVMNIENRDTCVHYLSI